MHRHDSRRRHQGGFTFLEIIIAVAVLAMLAGTIAPMVGSAMFDGKRTQAQEETKAIVEAIGRYRQEYGQYPAGEQNANGTYNYGSGSASAITKLNEALVHGTKKFLNKAIGKDPWGREYWYHIYTLGNPYQDVVVLSCGPDGSMSTWDGAVWNTGKFNGDDIGAFYDQ